MGPGQSGDSVPDDAVEVQILHPVAVNMNFRIARQPLDLLNDAALCPMLLVEER
jgi:hypothetical protein